MDVSENSGTPKSSILIGFSNINHPFWDTPIFWNTQIGSSPPKKITCWPRLTGRARPAGAVCGIPTRRLSETWSGISGDVRTFQSQFSFQGEEMAVYLYCIYVFIYIYVYYIHIGFREGYMKLNIILIVVQSNNFPQLSNIKLCVVRHIFIAAGARHGYATWRKVEGGEGAVTWLVLLNNTQLGGSWDMYTYV